MSTLKENAERLIAYADKRGVKLVAATKTVSAEIINEAISYGLRAIGENKVQELLEKYNFINKENIEIHFIGKLQTNKVKYIIDKVDLIHSVDNINLAAEINKRASKIGKVQDVLVQVNVSNEESKGGVNAEELSDFLLNLSKFESIRVKGLMCIPSPEVNYGDNAKYFTMLHKMLVDNNGKNVDNINMDILSMGMSSDYETAVNCGATIIRVGTGLFGKRNYGGI